jgi:hypothetical protein
MFGVDNALQEMRRYDGAHVMRAIDPRGAVANVRVCHDEISKGKRVEKVFEK